MAKTATRVNGRNNETMWVDRDELCFRSAGEVHRMSLAKLLTIGIKNIEVARAAAEDTEREPVGVWVTDMSSSGGKTDFLVVTDSESCWIMEINKSQAPNALQFVQGIRPYSEKELKEEKKEYAAVQTPLGAAFTLGSIICVFGAMFCVWTLELPLVGLALAAAAIVMFVNIK